MKIRLLFLGISLLFSMASYAQPDEPLIEESVDRALKENVLESIQKSRDSADLAISSELVSLEKRILLLDSLLNRGVVSEKEKVQRLLERVKLIEDVQDANQQAQLNTFQGNYQSAVINLVSMDRELKPLVLFSAAKDFYSSLNNVSNPTTYPGFTQWFATYKAYLERERKKEATAAVVSNLLSITGDLTKGTPLSGPLAQTLFVSIGNFVNSIGSNQKELRAQSEKMFGLTMTLSQFTHDKDLIETEWDDINKELAELSKIYNQALVQNLRVLEIDTVTFKQRFTKETDANRRFVYLNELTKVISDAVAQERTKNPKAWKETFRYEMKTVQSLKVRFGNLTFRISQNLGKYQSLIDKYKNDPEVGSRVKDLEIKLKSLKGSFDDLFDPLEYIKSADRMYKED